MQCGTLLLADCHKDTSFVRISLVASMKNAKNKIVVLQQQGGSP